MYVGVTWGTRAPAKSTSDRLSAGGNDRHTSAAMLSICARHTRGGIYLCNYLTTQRAGGPAPCHVSTSQPSLSKGHRDYSLPNASWSQNLQDLYNKYQELTKNGDWKRLPSYNTSVHHREGDPMDGERENRLFTRNLDKDGVGLEYCMFYNKAEKRMVCIFQPGPYLEGPPGFLHGGCTATMIDSTAGGGAVCTVGPVFTANLNIDYRNPILLGSTAIADSTVEKVDGRKVYTRCTVRGHDDKVVYAEATGLFILTGLFIKSSNL
uniref:Acyl-coenzyme A thioesterase THEM4 n=1 Tax=Leptobrachium leishanense TaxID=445787 RepID=A0A8C5Q167_9ANUR